MGKSIAGSNHSLFFLADKCPAASYLRNGRNELPIPRCFHCPAGYFTIRTLQGADRTTCSATLPRSSRSKPRFPWVPSTSSLSPGCIENSCRILAGNTICPRSPTVVLPKNSGRWNIFRPSLRTHSIRRIYISYVSYMYEITFVSREDGLQYLRIISTCTRPTAAGGGAQYLGPCLRTNPVFKAWNTTCITPIFINN